MRLFKPQSKSTKTETMSVKNKFNCRKCSTVLIFMALLQATIYLPVVAQGDENKWQAVSQWMIQNLEELGGRAILLVHDKNGNIVYRHIENNLSRKQKMIGKFLAKRQGKNSGETIADFDENSRQRIASCSKWLSAALMMTFVDEGKISLEDTIGKWLPIMTKNGKGNIKIWHCLSHLTGIKQAGIAGDEMPENEDSTTFSRRQQMIQKMGGNTKSKTHRWTSMKDAMESIASQSMEGAPGKTFHYGNTGLQIAAAIVEIIGGKNFETLFAERIGKPCNMSNTDFGHVSVPLAAGGAFSTPVDYINFLQMILNYGKYNGKEIISPKSIAAMQVNYAKGAKVISSPAEAGSWGFGFGEWVMESSSVSERSNAVTSPGLFGSFPWVDNEKGYCGFLFTFNIKSKGRNEKYKELKRLVDEAVGK